MTQFKSFDSFEQMVEFMQQNERAANDAVTDEQRAIGYGDCYALFDGASGLVIFGEIDTLEGVRERMTRNGHPEEEIEEDMTSIRETHERGYRFGRAYSVACSEGELGDTHISRMHKIEREHFDMAREFSWSWHDLVREAGKAADELSKMLAMFGTVPTTNAEARAMQRAREHAQRCVWIAELHEKFSGVR